MRSVIRLSLFARFTLKSITACIGVTVAIHILLPLAYENLKCYGIWLNVSTSHFASYPDPLKTFGREIPADFGWWMELVAQTLIRMILSCIVLVGGLFANHDWPNVQFYRPKTRVV